MMPKRDQTLRSPAVTFALAPTDPEFATLDSEPMPDQLTATNGAVRALGRKSAANFPMRVHRVGACILQLGLHRKSALWCML